MEPSIRVAQLAVCERLSAQPSESPDTLKAGLAKNARGWELPLNGLRHPPEGDTSGWYIWSGTELSDDPDFFEPVHVAHLSELCPLALPYLLLPPGWRFLLAPDIEDLWFDAELLEI